MQFFAERLEGFAGLYLLPDSASGSWRNVTAFVRLTHTADPLQATRLVEERLRAHGFEVQRVKIESAAVSYSYLIQLLEDIVAAVRPVDIGLFGGGVDVVRNRVALFATNLDGQAALQATVAQMGLPAQVVAIELRDPIVPRMALARTITTSSAIVDSSLQLRFNPKPGGIQAGASRECSIGFNVEQNGVSRFITAAHCSGQPGVVDGAGMIQPYSSVAGLVFANEYKDPAFFPPSAPQCTRHMLPCRFTDASMYTYTSGVPEFGKIAEANDNVPTLTSGGARVTILGAQYGIYVGSYLEKMGSTSGRTGGAITNTCVNIYDYDISSTQSVDIMCQIEVAMYVGDGDSGSPVYFRDDSYSGGPHAHLAGISVASYVSGNPAYVSRWNYIEDELASGPGTLGLVGVDPAGCAPGSPC